MIKTVTDEKTYITESLDFINTYKTSFTPVLSDIASNMNNDANKELIAEMRKMITAQNSNLKELIVKLMVIDSTKDYDYINYNDDFTKYVQECLTIMRIKGSKEIIYELFNLVMQDLKLQENADLMAKVKKIKENTTQWKKMVGMLIPPGARVKILANIIEPVTQFAVGKHRNKSTSLTSRELVGTVVTRGKLSGYVAGRDFKKVVRLPKEIIRKDNLAYKNEEIMVDPEDIELHVPNAEIREETVAGTPVAEGRESSAEVALASGAEKQSPKPVAPISPEKVIVDNIKGGQQRLTRKQKNSIIGTARKTRTNR